MAEGDILRRFPRLRTHAGRASPSHLHRQQETEFPDRFLLGKTRSARTPLTGQIEYPRLVQRSKATAIDQPVRQDPATAWKPTPWHECEDLEQRTSLPKSRLSSALRLILGASLTQHRASSVAAENSELVPRTPWQTGKCRRASAPVARS
jgi:hypothetical protein